MTYPIFPIETHRQMGDEQQTSAGTSVNAAKAFRIVKPQLDQLYVETTFLTRLCKSFSQEDNAKNEIKTSKYTVITFLPVNLFEQFCRVANFYFLICAILQLIPGLSPTSWFTTVAPLAIVLTINAVKEGYDDYWRHRSDNEINSRLVKVLRPNGEQEIQWRDVALGDIVKVTVDQEFPADLIFISSSDPDNLCYVETANLDGETNLKNKNCFLKTAGCKSAEDLVDWAETHEVHCELPNPRLYSFDGAVVSCSPTGAESTSLGPDNLLLRACTLRGTDWVLGLVVFTGQESKIMMNRHPAARKVTQLERHMNILVSVMFVLLFVMASLLAMGEVLWLQGNDQQWPLKYLNAWPDFNAGFPAWIVQLLRFVILTNGIIPISLYVTLEVVKVLQCMLVLNPDLEMYDEVTDTPFSCHTTTLNEDLGQVQYVLSDKTGTLTQNVMGFVMASIGGRLYGHAEHPPPSIPDHSTVTSPSTPAKASLSNARLSPIPMLQSEDMLRSQPTKPAMRLQPQPPVPPHTPHSLLVDPEFRTALGYGGEGGLGPVDPMVERFMTHLAVCNTVVPSQKEGGVWHYQATSPDEEALVVGAAYAGYRLVSRSTEQIVLEVDGVTQTYQLLATLEFNSDRKRMSVIVRCPDGRIRLYCKGADTMVMARLRPNQPNISTVHSHLATMAQMGYRTLVVAERELSQEVYQSWAEQYATASVALQDRETKVSAVSEMIEKELTLLGATAVEDKLQDGVPEAVADLLRAGIQVWVLTGDKVETAISIALAARLFDESMSLVELRERDFEGGAAEGDTEAKLAIFTAKMEEIQLENSRMGCSSGRSNVGLVVEGGALALVMHSATEDALMDLCSACKSVVCCRVTPMQKAQVTLLVRRKRKAITLGIGDGANDVGMIQAAHIGCGISGREGRAAVMASDFSFAQFRFVTRLLLLHGRAMYKRNTEVIYYAFYKNWVYNMPLVFYAFYTGFSAQPLFTTALIATFNVVWTAYPIGAYAVLEQDVRKSTVLRYPILYSETSHSGRREFFRTLAVWMALACWHALVVFFVPLYATYAADRIGEPDNLMEVGTDMYTSLLLVVNLKVAMRTHHWTWINHLLIWAFILLWFPYLTVVSYMFPVIGTVAVSNMSAVAPRLFSSPSFWLGAVLLAPGMALLPDIAYDSFQRTFFPKPFQILQEREQLDDYEAAAVREMGLRRDRSSKREIKGQAHQNGENGHVREVEVV